MKRIATACAAVAAGLTMLANTAANAQDASSEWRWSLGAGIGIAPDYEGSDDYAAQPFPLVRAQNKEIYVALRPDYGALAINSNVLQHPNWRLGPIAALRLGQRDVKDKRVDKIRSGGTTAFELGLLGGYDLKIDAKSKLAPSVAFLADVSGVYDGYQIIPQVGYDRRLSDRWALKVNFSGTFASGGYMSEYFGIDSKDATRSGLDRFDADASFKDLALGANVNYDITKSWAVQFATGFKRLLGDAEDSPVTDDQGDENQFTAGVSFTYAW